MKIHDCKNFFDKVLLNFKNKHCRSFDIKFSQLLYYHSGSEVILFESFGDLELNYIDKLEANLLKQFLKIPNDITGKFASKLCNRNKRKTSEVIQSIIENRLNYKVFNNPAADSSEETQ